MIRSRQRDHEFSLLLRFILVSSETLNSSALHVSWVPPTISNGVVRQYQVFVDDQKLYQGGDLEAIVTDLSPYT